MSLTLQRIHCLDNTKSYLIQLPKDLLYFLINWLQTVDIFNVLKLCKYCGQFRNSISLIKLIVKRHCFEKPELINKAEGCGDTEHLYCTVSENKWIDIFWKRFLLDEHHIVTSHVEFNHKFNSLHLRDKSLKKYTLYKIGYDLFHNTNIKQIIDRILSFQYCVNRRTFDINKIGIYERKLNNYERLYINNLYHQKLNLRQYMQ